MTHNSEDENWFVGAIFITVFFYVMYRYAKFMDGSIFWVRWIDKIFNVKNIWNCTQDMTYKNIKYHDSVDEEKDKNEYRAKSYDDINKRL